MNDVFGDSFYFLALLNPRDAAHGPAVAASRSLPGRLVTTEYVLIEVADALSSPRDRPRFLALMDAIETDPDATIVPAESGLLRRGLALFRARPDKDWPLTDCLSFVVMTELGLTEALTGDRHFLQAGFRPLLAPP
jgi:hypothetical protein